MPPKVIRLSHIKSGERRVGRNFVRTPKEAEAFQREFAVHRAETARLLFPRLKKEVEEFTRKKVAEINHLAAKELPREALEFEWLEGIDVFITGKLPLSREVKAEARQNKLHETRLTTLMTDSLRGQIFTDTARLSVEKAIEQLKSFQDAEGMRLRERNLGMIESEMARLSKEKGKRTDFPTPLAISMKMINVKEFGDIVGKEYSDLYFRLYMSAKAEILRNL